MHEDVHILKAPHKRKTNEDITSLSDQLTPHSCCKRCRLYRTLASIREWRPLERGYTRDGFLVIPSYNRDESEERRQRHIKQLRGQIKALGICGRCRIWKDVGDALDHDLLD